MEVNKLSEEVYIDMIRMVMIAHRFERNDGQGLVNFQVALGALENGYQLTLLTAHCHDALKSHPNATVVFVGREELPTQLLKNLAFASESAKWLRKHRSGYDLVQGNGFITWAHCDIVTAHFVHTSWLKSRYFPFPATNLRPSSLYQRIFTLLNARWERRAFANARCVVAVSQLVAEEVAELGISSKKIVTINSGIDTTRFHPGSSERDAFGLPVGVKLGLFVGDIHTPRKNLETVLRALKEVPDLHLAVAGESSGSPYPALAVSLGVSGRVHFLGKVSRIPELMRSSDLFILLSRYETYGLVVLEAMASGLPAIISRNMGVARLAGPSTVILNDPNDAGSLALALKGLLESPERMQELGESARTRALGLQWNDTVSQYLALYESLLDNKPR